MPKEFPKFCETTVEVRPQVGKRFQALIEANPRAGLPVGYYAVLLRVSEARLAKECHRFAKQTPLQMIQACLIRKAELMLRTNLPVKVIAFSLGFEDPAYFARFFRQKTGKTPTEFRSRVNEPTANVKLVCVQG